MNPRTERGASDALQQRFAECTNCACRSADIVAAGGRCPRTVPLTEPGPLAELREPKPPRGTLTRWLLASVALVAACYVVVDLASRGWTAL